MPQAESRSITPPLPKTLPKAARTKVQDAIEAHLSAIDALTAFLDEADGDTDDEDDGADEPSLAGRGATYDAEYFNQEAYASGSNDDCEGDEHDGREPDVDEEPSLAHTNDVNQEKATKNLLAGPNVFASDLEDEHEARSLKWRAA